MEQESTSIAEETPDDLVPAASGEGVQEGTAEPTKDQILEAMKTVFDPELGVNIVDLGLVYEVRIEQGDVAVEYTLTTMGCPIGPLIEAQIADALGKIPGVTNIATEMVLRPPWSPEMMSEEAKAALGYF